jgi:hypothetical protein
MSADPCVPGAQVISGRMQFSASSTHSSILNRDSSVLRLREGAEHNAGNVDERIHRQAAFGRLRTAASD